MPPFPVRARRSVPTLPLLCALALVGGACDDGAGPRLEPGNVDVRIGAVVEQTDTAVIVDGTPMLRYPSTDAAVWIERSESYDFGGFPERGLPDSARRSVYWTVTLTHEYPRVAKGDSLIFRFVDHGDAAVAGTAMEKLTDLPSFTPGAPLRFINFVRYLATPYHRVEWAEGGTTTFEHAPYFDDFQSGLAVAIATLGSAESTPLSGTVAARPLPVLAAAENDGALDLAGSAVPTVDVTANLALSFDGTLDPARSFLHLVPIDRATFPNSRSAFIQPRSTTDRVVIPADVLADLRPATPAGPAPFLLLIIDITVGDDVLAGALLEDDTPFSLPGVQQGATSLYLYLE